MISVLADCVEKNSALLAQCVQSNNLICGVLSDDGVPG
jgi:hypothetical protein